MLAALEHFVGGYMSNQMAIGSGGMTGAQAAAYGGMFGGVQQGTYPQPGGAYGPPAGSMGAYANLPQHLGGMLGAPCGGVVGGASHKSNPGTLRMRGIPFRSTVDDVLRFFAGFQVRAQPRSPAMWSPRDPSTRVSGCTRVLRSCRAE